MPGTIGIRKETKDATQRRAPLSPDQVRKLIHEHGIKVLVEPWNNRVFGDDEYTKAGADVTFDLSPCNILFGVKEVYPEYQIPDKAYVFFSHTAKGQAYNMPMLRSLMEKRISLFDYELVKDEDGKRLIFFGDYAGYAGMIDSLWALGRRLRLEKIHNPFDAMHYATSYDRVDDARDTLKNIAEYIRTQGLDDRLVPFVTGFTGYGQVSKAAQSLFDLLPVKTLDADGLEEFFRKGDFDKHIVYKVEFRKNHMYRHSEGKPFNNELFKEQPELFEENFSRFLPYLTLLINGIYWEPRFPKIVTKAAIKDLFERYRSPRLRIIGDITCDIDGSVELTVKPTNEDNPVFVYLPYEDKIVDGWAGNGPVVLAVDKLPTELPRESSESFGSALSKFVPQLAQVDFRKNTDQLKIPAPFRPAMITHNGNLTTPFDYLKGFLDSQ